ncbi:MAG: hypothetical protein AB7U20_18100 [Planctomycetaceae bacterium]
MISRLILVTALGALTTTAAAFAPPQTATSVEVIGRELSSEQCLNIRATGDCEDIGPPTGCGEDYYCSENKCTGIPHVPEGRTQLSKDCRLENDDEIFVLDLWHDLYMNDLTTGYEDVHEVDRECVVKCNCDEYCTDYDDDPIEEEWICDVTDECILTGHYKDPGTPEGTCVSE